MDSEEMKIFSELLEGLNLFQDFLDKAQPIPDSSTVPMNVWSMATPNELDQWRVNWVLHSCKMCKLCNPTLYRCLVCDDLYECVTCYKKNGHHHEMKKLALELDNEISPADEPPKSIEEKHKLCILRFKQLMEHARQCRNDNCSMPSCLKMRHVVQHGEICKRQADGGCPICKQVINFSCHRPKYCQETKCRVPFCQSIKDKKKHQQMQARIELALRFRRRMAEMLSRGSSTNLRRGQSNRQLIQQNRSEVPGSSSVNVRAMRNFVLSRQTELELLQTLRSPNTAEQKRRILEILRGHHEQLSVFLRLWEQQRTMNQQ